MTELYFLLASIIICAFIVVEGRSLMSSVAALGAIGLVLCIVFSLLRATDVAVTQLTVEILVLAILIKTTGIERDMAESHSAKNIFSMIFTAVFIAIFCIVFVSCLSGLNKFGSPLLSFSEKYIADGTKETGAMNIVCAILLGYRPFDTLGVISVFFASIAGVVLILAPDIMNKPKQNIKTGIKHVNKKEK